MKYLIVDCETTGLFNRNPKSVMTWESPRLVSFAWLVYDSNRTLISKHCHIVKPQGFNIPAESSAIHGITTEHARENGLPAKKVLSLFSDTLIDVKYIISHNISFDR